MDIFLGIQTDRRTDRGVVDEADVYSCKFSLQMYQQEGINKL